MLNHITIQGRICNDIELRRTPNGVPAVNFAVAVDRDFKNASGEKETDFIDVVCWRNTAEFVHQYFSKGRMAIVSGRLQVRSWTDKDGNKRKTAEIVAENVYFGDSKQAASDNSVAHIANTVMEQSFDILEGDFSALPF